METIEEKFLQVTLLGLRDIIWEVERLFKSTIVHMEKPMLYSTEVPRKAFMFIV